MTHVPGPPRLTLARGDADADHPDARVSAVLEALGGAPVTEVAARWQVDVAVLHRWVRAFVAAGSAQVTHHPDRAAAAQRDRFLAAVAHELRTPLTVAQGWVAVLDDDDLPPGALAPTVERLHESLQQLADRVVDLELLAAASLGLLRTAPTRTTVGELVAGLPGLTEVHGEGPEAVLEVDPDHFRRVLRDLWAAGFSMPEPSEVRLDVRRVGPWTELCVVRRAEPIDSTVLQALFEPFDRNDDATGVTIGLYLARALTVVHGGTIGVAQDSEGAELWVRVPAADAHSEPARADPEERP